MTDPCLRDEAFRWSHISRPWVILEPNLEIELNVPDHYGFRTSTLLCNLRISIHIHFGPAYLAAVSA